MENVEDDYPDFYAEYQAAKKIDDLGIRHKAQGPPSMSAQVPPKG